MIIIIPNENSLSYSSLKSNSTNWPNKFIPAFKSKHAQAEEKSLAGEYSVTRSFTVRCAWTILWSRTVYARAHPILTAHNVCIYVYVCMYVSLSLSLSVLSSRARALSLVLLFYHTTSICRFRLQIFCLAESCSVPASALEKVLIKHIVVHSHGFVAQLLCTRYALFYLGHGKVWCYYTFRVGRSPSSPPFFIKE